MVVDIFITSWFRKEMTQKTIDLIYERTAPGTFAIHVFDNGSDRKTQDFLYGLLMSGKIVSLHLDSRNTGCLYNKAIYYQMANSKNKYFCVTDNDVFPPKLSPDWLSQMVAIMDVHPDLAFLVPQIPPQVFQGPDMSRVKDDIVYCKAVGNTFKLVRRKAFPLMDVDFALGKFGDDSVVSELVKQRNYEVAFCRNIFAFHAGQCENWGYKEEEIARDPRKAGYGNPYTYELVNEETFEPESGYRI